MARSRFDPCGVPALIRYEIFLSEIFSANGRACEVSPEEGCSCGMYNGTTVNDESGSGDDWLGSTAIESLCCTIFTIATDVIALTASDDFLEPTKGEEAGKSSESNRRQAQNIILPTLLRILSHAVRLLGVYLMQSHQKRPSQGYGERLTGVGSLDNACFETLATVTLAAASFTVESKYEKIPEGSASFLNPVCLSPCLDDELSPSHSVASCSYPPVSGSVWDKLLTENSDACLERQNFLQHPAVDFDSAALSSPWLDNDNGVGQRAGMELLNMVFESTRGIVAKVGASKSYVDKQECTLLQKVVSLIGQTAVTKVTRAHFFGRLTRLFRDISASKKDSATGPLVPTNNKPVQNTTTSRPWFSPHISERECVNKVSDVLSHDRIPSRVHSSLRIICSFRFPDVVSSVLDDFLPICHTLIDSHNTTHQALGASALLHVMRECTPTAFAPHRDLSSKVLELGCRICRDATALAVLSRVRAALFESFMSEKGPDTSSALAAPRRKVTSDLLALVRMQRGDNKALIAGVLIGGINMLLNQHASMPNADAMEMLRPGLMTILPLIRWDGTGTASRTVQLAALAGLTSLLMGAHPLAPRHGGKIMAEVLSCLGRAERDIAIGGKVRGGSNLRSDSAFREHMATKAVSAFAVHVASVVLVLCRDRAEDVLLSVERGGYEANLAHWCSKVREGAKRLIKEENANNLALGQTT
uniref:Uncharacterized protein n=1 Tax=Odontella aurita TaxID=265563 RepID=A0A7S4HTL0_9STRA